MPQGSFREKIYRYGIRRGAPAGADQALGPQPQAQQYTPRPPAGRPNPWDTHPADAVKNLIRSGRTDTQIATETGLDASVVAIVRAQLAAAHQ